MILKIGLCSRTWGVACFLLITQWDGREHTHDSPKLDVVCGSDGSFGR